MVAECVGLDLGQTAIKAVRFRRRLSGRESVEYFHLPLPYGKPVQAEPARLAGHLRNFLWQHGLYGSGDIVTALPCQDLFIRTLSFPFRDSAKLEQVVPFEVENLIPMALDELLIAVALVWAAWRSRYDGACWHLVAWGAFCALALVLLVQTAVALER